MHHLITVARGGPNTVDNLAFLGLWHTTGFGARNNRVTGPGPRWIGPGFGWNAYSWDVAS